MIYPFSPGQPAFPVLPTTIFQLEGSVRTATMLAMVDTGADGTLAPRRLLTAINADRMHSIRIRSHWGDTRTAFVYIVDLEIADQRLPGVEVVADEHTSDVLLGRNVLNRLILLLDGPGQVTEILTRRPRRL